LATPRSVCDNGKVADGKSDRGDFDELVEMERATALLQGRDPSVAESIVAARFATETQRHEREELLVKRREATLERQRAKRRRIGLGAVAAVVLGAVAYWLVGVGSTMAKRADRLRDALGQASTAASELGFSLKEDWLDVGPGGVTLDVPAGTCSAVVAVREEGGDGPFGMRIERALKGQVEGQGGLVWCACEAEKAKVTLPAADKTRHALRWLVVPGTTVGGIEVLASIPLRGFSTYIGEFDHSCADEAFARWSATAGHGDVVPLPAELDRVARTLQQEGLEPVGQLPAERKFVVVRSPRGRCTVAAPDVQLGGVSLRAQDGAALLVGTSKPFAWCTYGQDTTVSLWHEEGSQARYVLFSAAAVRVGGYAGLRELGARLNLGALELVASPESSAEDAVAALRASTVTDASIVTATEQGLPGNAGRLVASFSLRREGSFQPAGKLPMPIACRAKPDDSAPVNAYVCVQAQPQSWRPAGLAKGQAAAEAELPFWLSHLGGSADPGAIDAAASLLAFARRLALLGFEPTTTEGIRDTPRGAAVAGRSGKKEVVALAITKARPWIHPLSLPASEPWTIDGPLSAAALAADGSVELQTTAPLGADPSARRIVVWRR
jgi:hypothetical protein